MTFAAYSRPFLWDQYSEKLKIRILEPYSMGEISEEECGQKNLRRVFAHSKSVEQGFDIKLFFAIDSQETIIDMRYLVFGATILVGTLEMVAELLCRKQTRALLSLSRATIDKALRDTPTKEAFPEEAFFLVDKAIDLVKSSFEGLPNSTIEGGQKKYEQFSSLSKDEQKKIVEEILDAEIRPFMAMDGGGIELIDIVDSRKIIVRYSGECAGCFAAHGSTLGYIQAVVEARLPCPIEICPVDLKREKSPHANT